MLRALLLSELINPLASTARRLSPQLRAKVERKELSRTTMNVPFRTVPGETFFPRKRVCRLMKVLINDSITKIQFVLVRFFFGGKRAPQKFPDEANHFENIETREIERDKIDRSLISFAARHCY